MCIFYNTYKIAGYLHSLTEPTPLRIILGGHRWNPNVISDMNQVVQTERFQPWICYSQFLCTVLTGFNLSART
jgi:hypothetical protein